MPIHPNPAFNQPEPDEKLWRYMNVPKFLSLVTSGSMWFATPKGLEREDPLEGFFPPNLRDWRVPRDPVTGGEVAGIGRNFDRGAQRIFEYPEMAQLERAKYSINCWHSSSIESPAMWRSYGRDDAALAIVTNLPKMQVAFNATPETIHCGRVQYVDFQRYFDYFKNGDDIVLLKREQFKSENEVRLVCPQSQTFEYGREIKCSVNDLINDIWISPTAPPWLRPAIERLCKLVGLDARIINSPLLKPPGPLKPIPTVPSA